MPGPLEPWTTPAPEVTRPARFAAVPDMSEPEPIAARSDDLEPEPMLEPVAATAPPEPEAEPRPPTPRTLRPIGDTILHLPQSEQPVAPAPPALSPLAAEDPMAAARRAQLDLLGLEDPGQGSLQATRQNVIPYRSSGAAASPTHSRAQAPNAFWDASAREVAGAMSAIGVQSCGQCGLSLSASAASADGAARGRRSPRSRDCAGAESQSAADGGAGLEEAGASVEVVPPPLVSPDVVPPPAASLELAGVAAEPSGVGREAGVVVPAFDARASFR